MSILMHHELAERRLMYPRNSRLSRRGRSQYHDTLLRPPNVHQLIATEQAQELQSRNQYSAANSYGWYITSPSRFVCALRESPAKAAASAIDITTGSDCTGSVIN